MKLIVCYNGNFKGFRILTIRKANKGVRVTIPSDNKFWINSKKLDINEEYEGVIDQIKTIGIFYHFLEKYKDFKKILKLKIKKWWNK